MGNYIETGKYINFKILTIFKYTANNQTVSLQPGSEFWNLVVNNQNISQCLHGRKSDLNYTFFEADSTVSDDSNYTLYEVDCETEMASVCFGCGRGKK